MKTLYIDTHETKSFHIGYFKNGELSIEQGQDCAKEMIEKIDALTNNEIDEIIINKGPGSLSGLRIGASFAQGISLGKNITIKSISIWTLILNEYPNIDIFFYTGTKKWIKQNINEEQIYTETPLNLHRSQLQWTSNNPDFFQNLNQLDFIQFPNIIELMHKYKNHAEQNAHILYPINFFK